MDTEPPGAHVTGNGANTELTGTREPVPLTADHKLVGQKKSRAVSLLVNNGAPASGCCAVFFFILIDNTIHYNPITIHINRGTLTGITVRD